MTMKTTYKNNKGTGAMRRLFRLAAVPAAARWMGLGGLIPFIGLAIAVCLLPASGPAQIAAAALLFYAGTIASFLGAVHWGVAFPQAGEGGGAGRAAGRALAWGVVPALIAWLLLLSWLIAAPIGHGATVTALIAMIALLAACWMVDEARFEPDWWRTRYLPLRRVLTLGAGASLAAAATGLLVR